MTSKTDNAALALGGAPAEAVILPPGGIDGFRGPLPSYMDKSRDLRIDLLRGYFVVAMIVDHVRGQSPLYFLTGGNRFYTSAAEGFIFISGLVAGLVYGRYIRRDGLGRSFVRLLARAGVLYLLTIAVTLLLLPLSEILYLPWAQGVDLSNPLRVVMSILMLHRTYYLIDVMLLYTVLFVLVPLAFALMTEGKSAIVLGASWLLWAIYQVYPDYASMPWPIAGNYLFDFSAWQVLFFTGLVLGYHRNRIPPLRGRAAYWALGLAALGMAALVAVYIVIETPIASMPPDVRIGRWVFPDARAWLQHMVFSKVSLRPGRLLSSAIVFPLLFFITSLGWPVVHRVLGWLMLPLGQHALYAYTAHIAIASLVAIAVAPLNLAYPGPQWLNAAIQIASVLLIWLLVRWRILMPTPRTQRFWYASPAVICLAFLLVFTLYPAPAHPGLAAPTLQSTSQDRIPRRFGTPIPPQTPIVASAAQRFGSPVPLGAVPQPRKATPPPIEVEEEQTTLEPTPSAAPPTPVSSTLGSGAEPTSTPLGTLPATATPTKFVSPTPRPTSRPIRWTPTPTPEPRPPLLANLRERIGEYLDPAIRGTVEEQWFYSPELDRDMPYLAYLPPDYGKAGRRYPVLYMLHGAAGHRDEWVALGLFNVADREIRTGNVQPMIIIIPQGDLSYFVNHADDGPRWGEYIVRDLVAEIDLTYRTLRAPESRALGGFSMGAYGALSNAFRHPEVFGVVGAHSPSLRPDDGSVPFLGTGAEFESKDPIALVKTLSPNTKLRIWVDIGFGDQWLPLALPLQTALEKRGIPHTWQLYGGTHDWAYWKAHLVDYVRFYGQALAPRRSGS